MARRTSRRREHRAVDAINQRPFGQAVNPYPPIEPLSADHVAAIHDASLTVLEELGMEILDAEARERLERAGCDVDHGTGVVRFDRGFIEERVAKAPAEFTVRARNPAHSLHIGGNRISFHAVGGPAFCSDLDKGRRSGTIAEVRDFLRVCQSLNAIHSVNGLVFAPLDQPAEVRHLDAYTACATLTDKVWAGSLLGRHRAADTIEIACIAFDTDRDGLKAEPAVFGNINTNSPRRLDEHMAQGAIEFAEAGQPVVVTPFTLSGAMSPATIAGALVQQNAEALMGIALVQTVNPGTPTVYGSFTSNVDMRTGSPAFGTPEYVKATMASAQLARHYGLPIRASNTNASNVVDAQAAYESEMSIWACAMGHVNLMFHAGGWLEGGLTASFEKLVIDAEMLQMAAAMLDPLVVDDDSLGLSAIREVAPGGHYFGTAHTMARYETAFYKPIVSDWRNYETWEEAGSKDATVRANGIWKHLLATYEQPGPNRARDGAIAAYVERRKREIAAMAST